MRDDSMRKKEDRKILDDEIVDLAILLFAMFVSIYCESTWLWVIIYTLGVLLYHGLSGRYNG